MMHFTSSPIFLIAVTLFAMWSNVFQSIRAADGLKLTGGMYDHFPGLNSPNPNKLPSRFTLDSIVERDEENQRIKNLERERQIEEKRRLEVIKARAERVREAVAETPSREQEPLPEQPPAPASTVDEDGWFGDCLGRMIEWYIRTFSD